MSISSRLATAFILPALLVSLVSCSVTSGSVIGTVIQAESRPGSESESGGGTESTTNDPDAPALTVTTTPRGAAVRLDGDRIGNTPVEIDDLAPGRYLLRVDKSGYHPVRRWIEISDDRALLIDLRLDPITGFLSVDAVPPDVEILVDGDQIDDSFAELPVGNRRITVRRFGYAEQEYRVTIEEDKLTTLRVNLEPAAFEVTELSVSRSRFNPSNPGSTGTVRVSFLVSAPGDGVVTVADADGTTIDQFGLPGFSTWEQSFVWPTTPVNLDDGEYTFAMELRGADGVTERQWVTVVVDSSLVIRYRSIWHSYPGLLYAAAPAPLPPKNLQVSFLGAGLVSDLTGVPVTRFPAKLGLRAGLGFGLEMAVQAGLIPSSEPLLDRWNAGLSMAWSPQALELGPFSLSGSIVGGASYRNPDPAGLYTGIDTLTDFPGFFLGIPLQIALGPVFLTAAPEYRLAPAPVVYGPATGANAWTHYIYGRMGLGLQLTSLMAGLSATVRSVPLHLVQSDGLVDLPVAGAAELAYVIPGTSMIVTGFAAGEFAGPVDFYVMGGLGLGFLF